LDHIILHENKTWPNSNNEDEKKLASEIKERLDDKDRKIIEELKAKKWFKIDVLENNIRIETTQFVGSVSFDNANFKLSVIPKIFDKDSPNVWKDTTAIIDFTDNIDMKDIVENQRIYFEENYEPTLTDHLNRQLVEECDKLLRRGLLRSYVVHAENTKSLRGKLLLQNQILNDAMCKLQFFSEYDELEYDNIENRMILQALTVAERNTYNHDLKMKTLRLAQQFSSVVEKVSISKHERMSLMQNYTRQNNHYKNTHKICELVIEKSGISDIYHGDYSLIMPFFVDMNRRFEQFVEKLFADYYDEEVKIRTQRSEKAWEVDESKDKKMRPDIIILRKIDGKIIKIIDTKYKPDLVESDLYQIGFYMHEYGVDQEQLEEAFAILPRYLDEKNGKIRDNTKNDNYTAVKSRKTIRLRRLDVDECVQAIKDGNEDKLRDIVKKLTD